MLRNHLSVFLCCGMLSWTTPNNAHADDNPYRVISQRNIFGLVSRESPSIPAFVEHPYDVKVNGIMTILGCKQALITVQVPDISNRQVRSESYILSEGQQSVGIRVVSIDERAENVKISNCGTAQLLQLGDNGESPHVLPELNVEQRQSLIDAQQARYLCQHMSAWSGNYN